MLKQIGNNRETEKKVSPALKNRISLFIGLRADCDTETEFIIKIAESYQKKCETLIHLEVELATRKD